MKNTNIVKLILLILLLTSCASKKNTTSKYVTNNSKSVLKPSKNSMEDFANVLGVSIKDLKNTKLYHYIDDWLTTPHKMGGLNKSGIDCSAFVNNLYIEIYNENLPRTSRDMADKIKRKYTKDLVEGDLVFFAFGGKNIDHVGVYLHNGKFVHVSTKKGVIISSLHDSWYGKYLVKCGSLK